MSTTLYQPSSIKRNRRTKDELNALLAASQTVLAREGIVTIRHLFYCLVSEAGLEKTEASYKQLGNHLTNWRKRGLIPWNAFADNTRWHIGTTTYDSAVEALENTVEAYRRNLWLDQDTYLEIWVEKDAIAGLVSDAANAFGVKTFVCRGFASGTSLYSAAETFKRWTERGKVCRIAYLGDHDPSGVVIDRIALKAFEMHGAEVEMERLAVTPEQIEQYNLPTRPAKAGDTRAKHWIGGCVEVDALPTSTLKAMVSDAITKHIEQGAWERLRRTEELERASLLETVNAFRRHGDEEDL